MQRNRVRHPVADLDKGSHQCTSLPREHDQAGRRDDWPWSRVRQSPAVDQFIDHGRGLLRGSCNPSSWPARGRPGASWCEMTQARGYGSPIGCAGGMLTTLTHLSQDRLGVPSSIVWSSWAD